ncbi:MAG TPA: ribonuclease domain-containing protein [Caldimonas sp.]|nr:ribonuclease domain-containing protein [Caldimonas sp.]
MGRLQPWRPLLRWGAGIGVAGLLAAGSVHAREAVDGSVPLARLPEQAQAVHRAILSGGPFAYPKDGIVFGNREHLLPRRSRGYYREYTVATPGTRDRGARRIVCGGSQPTTPDTCFYSDDHYNSFKRIKP